jgi:hypothetical protein
MAVANTLAYLSCNFFCAGQTMCQSISKIFITFLNWRARLEPTRMKYRTPPNGS